MMRSLGCFLYRLMGWKVVGEIPSSVRKTVIIVAPHTSWHDFYIGLLLRSVLDIKVNFVGKKELFGWPFGWYFRSVGGVPLDRTPGQNKVQAIAKIFHNRDEFRLAMAPEGTRKRVDKWKTGFYYIALEAGVPIVSVAMDFEKKEHRIAPPFYPSGDLNQDLPKLKSFFAGAKGKIPGNG